MRYLFSIFLLGFSVHSFDKSEFLDRLSRERDKEALLEARKEKGYSEIRPRGSSDNGEVAIFEKRIYRGHVKIFFYLFLLSEKKRKVYEIPSLRRRREFLDTLEKRYGYREASIVRIAITPDGRIESPSGVKYLCFIETEKGKPLCLWVSHLEREGEDRVVLVNYPLETGAVSPRIETAYAFEGGGLGIKLRYQRRNENRLIYREDIICFRESSEEEGEKRRVSIEDEFHLSLDQSRIHFLTDQFFDIFQRLFLTRTYFLDGHYRENSLFSP